MRVHHKEKDGKTAYLKLFNEVVSTTEVMQRGKCLVQGLCMVR